MNKRSVAKLGVQFAAVCFGVLGATWVYLGCNFAFIGIRDADMFLMFYMTPMFILLGAIVLAVAWQALRHFGPGAIRYVVGLGAFLLYSQMVVWLRPFQDATWKLQMRLHHAATFLIPLLTAYLLYRVLSRKLIEITSAPNVQETVSAASSKAATGVT